MEIVRPIEVIETEINFYKQQTATGIIEIGKRLIEAKAQLQHGEWGKWLSEKVEFSQDTANKFMKVANEMSNSDALRNLNQTKIFALLSIPQEEREQFIIDNKASELTTRQLQEAIRLKKEAEQRASNEIKARNEALQELSKEKEKAWNTQLELDKLKLQQPKVVEKVVTKLKSVKEKKAKQFNQLVTN